MKYLMKNDIKWDGKMCTATFDTAVKGDTYAA